MENKDVKTQNQRKDSERFIKVYMFCLIVVVFALISISYLSQDNLNNEIDRLIELVDTVEDEKEVSLSKVESLQKLTEEQEKIIKQYEEKLTEYEGIEKQSESLERIWEVKLKFLENKYAEAKALVQKIEAEGLNNHMTVIAKAEYEALKEEIIKAEALVTVGLLTDNSVINESPIEE